MPLPPWDLADGLVQRMTRGAALAKPLQVNSPPPPPTMENNPKKAPAQSPAAGAHAAALAMAEDGRAATPEPPPERQGVSGGGGSSWLERGGGAAALGSSDHKAAVAAFLLDPSSWFFAGVPRARVVLGWHAYAWSGPGRWSPKAFASWLPRIALQATHTHTHHRDTPRRRLS